jgi:hypothetical protein
MPIIVNKSQANLGVGTARLLPGEAVTAKDAGVDVVDMTFVEPGLEAWRRAGALAVYADGGVGTMKPMPVIGDPRGRLGPEAIMPVKRGRR